MYLGDVFTLSLNLAGMCGISLPCGFDAAGMPIGLQLMAGAFQEETVLRPPSRTSRRPSGIYRGRSWMGGS